MKMGSYLPVPRSATFFKSLSSRFSGSSDVNPDCRLKMKNKTVEIDPNLYIVNKMTN